MRVSPCVSHHACDGAKEIYTTKEQTESQNFGVILPFSPTHHSSIINTVSCLDATMAYDALVKFIIKMRVHFYVK